MTQNDTTIGQPVLQVCRQDGPRGDLIVYPARSGESTIRCSMCAGPAPLRPSLRSMPTGIRRQFFADWWCPENPFFAAPCHRFGELPVARIGRCRGRIRTRIRRRIHAARGLTSRDFGPHRFDWPPGAHDHDLHYVPTVVAAECYEPTIESTRTTSAPPARRSHPRRHQPATGFLRISRASRRRARRCPIQPSIRLPAAFGRPRRSRGRLRAAAGPSITQALHVITRRHVNMSRGPRCLSRRSSRGGDNRRLSAILRAALSRYPTDDELVRWRGRSQRAGAGGPTHRGGARSRTSQGRLTGRDSLQS